jgi:hypothetical protein
MKRPPALWHYQELGLTVIFSTMKIFLSHHSRDKALVREFRGMLPRFLDTWLDEDELTWGDSFPATLRSTIKSDVDFLIIFLDKDALNSRWVMQELEWAIQREEEIKRTFVLPILLGKIESQDLPISFSERLFLQLSNFNHESVEVLAKSAAMKLFQLVINSYSSLQLLTTSGKSLKSVRDELPAGQAVLLGYIVQRCKDGSEILQHQIEQGQGYAHVSDELYYRLECLIHQGFLSKRRISVDGQFSYRLTRDFLRIMDEA